MGNAEAVNFSSPSKNEVGPPQEEPKKGNGEHDVSAEEMRELLEKHNAISQEDAHVETQTEPEMKENAPKEPTKEELEKMKKYEGVDAEELAVAAEKVLTKEAERQREAGEKEGRFEITTDGFEKPSDFLHIIRPGDRILFSDGKFVTVSERSNAENEEDITIEYYDQSGAFSKKSFKELKDEVSSIDRVYKNREPLPEVENEAEHQEDELPQEKKEIPFDVVQSLQVGDAVVLKNKQKGVITERTEGESGQVMYTVDIEGKPHEVSGGHFQEAINELGFERIDSAELRGKIDALDSGDQIKLGDGSTLAVLNKQGEGEEAAVIAVDESSNVVRVLSVGELLDRGVRLNDITKGEELVAQENAKKEKKNEFLNSMNNQFEEGSGQKVDIASEDEMAQREAEKRFKESLGQKDEEVPVDAEEAPEDLSPPVEEAEHEMSGSDAVEEQESKPDVELQSQLEQAQSLEEVKAILQNVDEIHGSKDTLTNGYLLRTLDKLQSLKEGNGSIDSSDPKVRDLLIGLTRNEGLRQSVRRIMDQPPRNVVDEEQDSDEEPRMTFTEDGSARPELEPEPESTVEDEVELGDPVSGLNEGDKVRFDGKEGTVYAKFLDGTAILETEDGEKIPLDSLDSVEVISRAEEPGENKKEEGSDQTEDTVEGEDTMEDMEGIDFEAYEAFNRFNIAPEQLKSIGFDSLSPGEQRLIAQNFEQVALGQITAGTEQKYQQAYAGIGWLRRAGRAIFKDSFIKEKATKESFQDVADGGFERHGDVIKELVKTQQEHGPEAEINPDTGELEIHYLRESDFGENLDDEQKEAISKCNRLSAELSRIPIAWSLESATGSEKKKFLEATQSVRKAEIKLFEVMADKLNVAKNINRKDEMVLIGQYLSENPDVQKELKRIESDSVYGKGFRRAMAEKGSYMAAGFIGRTALVGALGVIAAPVVAAASGGTRAFFRAKEGLRKKDRAALKGEKDTSETAQNLADSKRTIELENQETGETRAKEVGLREKLSAVREQVMKESGDPDAKVIEKLQNRLQYTRDKMYAGKIDFGSGAEAIRNRFELIQEVAQAEAALETFKDTDEYGIAPKTEVEERLDQFLGYKERKVTSSRRRFIAKKTAYGAALGASFAAAGSAMAGGLGLGSSESSAEVPDTGAEVPVDTPEVPTVEASGAEDIDLSDLEVDEGQLDASPETVSEAGLDQTKDAVPEESATAGAEAQTESPATDAKPATENEGVPVAPEVEPVTEVSVTIKKGEGMINALGRTLEDKYGIDHEKAMEIANHVWAKNPNEWYNLVHEGDTFEVDLEGISGVDIQGDDARAVAEHISFNKDDFSAESGVAPEQDLASVRSPEQVAETPSTPVTGQSEMYGAAEVEQQLGSRIAADKSAVEFLTSHPKVRIDPESLELAVDQDGDGVISDKELHMKLGSTFENVGTISASVDKSGNLIIEVINAENTEHELITVSDSLDVQGVTEDIPVEALPTEDVGEKIIFSESRFTNKILKNLENLEKAIDSAKGVHPDVEQQIGQLNIQNAQIEKRALEAVLRERIGLDKKMAENIAKPLFRVIQRLTKAGIEFKPTDTIGQVINKLEFPEAQQ